MFFGKKKKKYILPFEEKKEGEKKSYRSTPQSPYNPLSEEIAQSAEEDNCLKNYAICYRDRNMAESKGDPMIKVVQAYSENEAVLEASRFIGGGFEILAIRFNGKVEYPNGESNYVYPTARPDSQSSEDDVSIGEIVRLRGKK